MNKRVLPKVNSILKESFKEAVRLGGNNIQPDHILLSLLNDNDNDVVDVLLGMGTDVEFILSKIEGHVRTKVSKPQIKKKLIPLSESSKSVVSSAELESDKLVDDYIGVEHIMLSILKNKTIGGTRILGQHGITYKTFKKTLKQIKKEINMNITGDYDETSGPKSTKSLGKTNTPVLDNFGRDVTKMAEEGIIDPIIGRYDEIERVCQILSRRKKNNPILIGEPGCVLGNTVIKVKKISDLSTHTFINQ